MRAAFALFPAVVLLLAACAATVGFDSVRIASGDRPPERVSALIARPVGPGPFPAVVLLHTCGGLMPHVSREWPGFLTGLGYVALSVDTFGSRGYGPCPNGMDKDYAAFVRDAYGALDWLAAQPFVDKDRVAVMGFSHGAIAINGVMIPWRIRAEGGTDFKAAIALYGHCNSVGLYPAGSIPLLEIIGEKDHDFAASCRYAAQVSPQIEVHILPGAHHAFDNARVSGWTDPYGHPMQYSAAATVEARRLTRVFLAKAFQR